MEMLSFFDMTCINFVLLFDLSMLAIAQAFASLIHECME